MALRPDDPSNGFRHSNVVAFINEKMARHTKGPEFYLENISLSWEEVEDKLRAILEDSEVPSEVKEACTWGSLALGVRFARRQAQLQRHRVQWLHGFAKLHKSAAQALASDLKELREQQETERKEAASRLRMAQTSLVEVQKERDKELVSPHEWEQGAGWPDLATAGRVCTEGAGEEEEEAAVAAAGAAGGKGAEEEQRDVEVVAAPVEAMAPPVEAGAAPMETQSPHVEAGAASMETTEGLERILLQLLGDADQENYTYWGQKEGDLRSVETASSYFSGTTNPWSRASPEPLPVQLPASFTYSYSSPFSSFSGVPTISPPQATVTAPVPPQLPSDWGAFDTSLWSDGGPHRIDPQEYPRDRRYSEPHQQRRPPVYRRPGDWDCPWCNAVNFSRRDTCFDCGRGIWLQKPH
ncbi:testis-expressed protein 13A [Pongo abelii]|uniref:TEX13A isoform 1 n=1 Tax=Pongo abelii TaxID=9601 RepID=A0A6D2X6T5_PONAB|nr:testis-expressed protein 13A [Pongo abelii]PNJ54668.1 TEX13A isoform 1 [Pongo abelii]PNJ54669.1 TEX13A isoform 2 [Pongo abelii]